MGCPCRLHAVPRLDHGHAPALVAGEIPLLIVLAEQLRKVLVGRNDHPAMAVRARLVQGAADPVVGFFAQSGSASSRERVCQYGSISEVAVSFKKKSIIYKSCNKMPTQTLK